LGSTSLTHGVRIMFTHTSNTGMQYRTHLFHCTDRIDIGMFWWRKRAERRAFDHAISCSTPCRSGRYHVASCSQWCRRHMNVKFTFMCLRHQAV